MIASATYFPGCTSTCRCHTLGGGWTDGDSGAADIARVAVDLEERAEKCVRSVWAREDDPVVDMGVGHQFIEFAFVARRLDADGRQFEGIRAERSQALHEFAGLQ